MTNFAKFEIKCDEIGFSQMHLIPLDSRGFVHQLAADLERAIEFYLIKTENHKFKQSNNSETDYLRFCLSVIHASTECIGVDKCHDGYNCIHCMASVK